MAQDIELSIFEKLQENDILFIDSTHVSKVGSDVNYIFFNILPVLKPGVLIHVHEFFILSNFLNIGYLKENGFGTKYIY